MSGDVCVWGGRRLGGGTIPCWKDVGWREGERRKRGQSGGVEAHTHMNTRTHTRTHTHTHLAVGDVVDSEGVVDSWPVKQNMHHAEAAAHGQAEEMNGCERVVRESVRVRVCVCVCVCLSRLCVSVSRLCVSSLCLAPLCL